MNFDQTFQTKPANETTAEQMLITRAQSAVVTSPSPSALGVPTASQRVQDLLSAHEISRFPEARYGGPGRVEACGRSLVASPPAPPALSVSPPSFLHLHPEPDRSNPMVDGRPSVSRRWATEPFPKSGKLSNASSDISRTSPTVWRPAATNTLRILDGNSTSLISVSSGSSGVGSSIFRSLISPSPSALLLGR